MVDFPTSCLITVCVALFDSVDSTVVKSSARDTCQHGAVEAAPSRRRQGLGFAAWIDSAR